MSLADVLVTGQCGYQHHALEETLRLQGPVHQAQVPGGPRVWIVTAGLDQTRLLLMDRRFSKDSDLLREVLTDQQIAAGQAGPDGVVELSGMFGPSMMMSDAPRHTRLRKLVSSAFTPSRVESLRPRVQEITTRLLSTLPTDEPIDLVKDFAVVLPVTVICEVLGVPVEDGTQVHAWTAALVLDDPELTRPASRAMTAYLEQLIARTRTEPDDGLISALVHASVDGEVLTADELMAMLFLLVVGGHETTGGLLSNAMYALLSEPSRWHSLVAEPALARAVVEETLRWDPPTRFATHRVTVEPITIGDTVVPARQIVLMSLSTAGRDPSSTDHAEDFDLQRTTWQHIGFGHGPHNCIGSPLARMQGEIALSALARRYPRTRLLDHNPPRLKSSIVGGLETLRLVLS